MNSEIYIRPLTESDAEISYRWRNDPSVWKLTGSRPDREITPKMERDWVLEVLERKNEIRFAICLRDTNEYIGNVQLTAIDGYQAEFHIFIGVKRYWGKGYGTLATKLMVDYAFGSLGLQCLYLNVRKNNYLAVRAYKKAEFVEVEGHGGGEIRMERYAQETSMGETGCL